MVVSLYIRPPGPIASVPVAGAESARRRSSRRARRPGGERLGGERHGVSRATSRFHAKMCVYTQCGTTVAEATKVQMRRACYTGGFSVFLQDGIANVGENQGWSIRLGRQRGDKGNICKRSFHEFPTQNK